MNEPAWWTRAQVRQLVQLKGADNLDGITQMAVAAYKQFDDIERLLNKTITDSYLLGAIQQRHDRYAIAIDKAEANSRLSYGIMLWWKRLDVRTLVEANKRSGVDPGASTYMMIAAYKQFDDIAALLALNANHEIYTRHERYRDAIARGEARDAGRESQEGHQETT